MRGLFGLLRTPGFFSRVPLRDADGRWTAIRDGRSESAPQWRSRMDIRTTAAHHVRGRTGREGVRACTQRLAPGGRRPPAPKHLTTTKRHPGPARVQRSFMLAPE